MARRFLSVLTEGITLTAVVAAFVASGAIVAHSMPAPIQQSSTRAADLKGTQPIQLNRQTLRVISVGEPLATPPAPSPGVQRFFQPASPRVFYPGTLSPKPQDIFRGVNAPPKAIKLVEIPIE